MHINITLTLMLQTLFVPSSNKTAEKLQQLLIKTKTIFL